MPMMNQNQQATILPIDRKMLLSIREAAEYSNIGINKIDEMLKQPNCPFVLYVGTKKLVKRKAFSYLETKATKKLKKTQNSKDNCRQGEICFLDTGFRCPFPPLP